MASQEKIDRAIANRVYRGLTDPVIIWCEVGNEALVYVGVPNNAPAVTLPLSPEVKKHRKMVGGYASVWSIIAPHDQLDMILNQLTSVGRPIFMDERPTQISAHNMLHQELVAAATVPPPFKSKNL